MAFPRTMKASSYDDAIGRALSVKIIDVVDSGTLHAIEYHLMPSKKVCDWFVMLNESTPIRRVKAGDQK